MLGSGWEVGPCDSLVHIILSLYTTMSTTQHILGQELITGQAVLSWPGLLAGWCLNLPVVLSCQSAQLCIREILQGQIVDGKAGVWGGGDHGGGGDVCLRQVDGVVRVG